MIIGLKQLERVKEYIGSQILEIESLVQMIWVEDIEDVPKGRSSFYSYMKDKKWDDIIEVDSMDWVVTDKKITDIVENLTISQAEIAEIADELIAEYFDAKSKEKIREILLDYDELY